jgi:hypothetical protein
VISSGLAVHPVLRDIEGMENDRGYRWARNPLVVAAESGDMDAVRRLAAEGADLSGPDANDEVPLKAAVPNLAMIELLLQLGADPRVWAGVYSPPMISACSANSILGKLLSRYGFHANGSDRYLHNLDRAFESQSSTLSLTDQPDTKGSADQKTDTR